MDKLITVMGPPRHATSMDTESFLDGAIVLSDAVQTALMNVSHFILGICFCAANGHNYVAKRRGAINKTELSTKFCRKQQAESLPLLAGGKRAARRGMASQGGLGEGRAPWALWAGRSWGNSSCHPCRSGFSLAFTAHVLPGDSPRDGITAFIVTMEIVMGSLCFSGAFHTSGLSQACCPRWEVLEVAEAFRNPSAVCQFLCLTPEHRGLSLGIGHSLNTGIGWMCPSFPVQLCFCKVASAFS